MARSLRSSRFKLRKIERERAAPTVEEGLEEFYEEEEHEADD